jgi:hypothetical protein
MLSNIKLYAIAGGAVLVCALIIGSFFYGQRVGKAELLASEKKQDDIVAAAEQSMLATAATAIAKIQVTHTTIKQEVEHDIREVPVYRDCVNTPDVERLLDDARANRLESKPAGNSSVSGVAEGTAAHVR